MSSLHLPWQTLGEPVELEVTAIKLDGEAFAFEPEKVIPLHESETDWQLAEITCAITMTAAATRYSPDGCAVSLRNPVRPVRLDRRRFRRHQNRSTGLHRNDLSLRLGLRRVRPPSKGWSTEIGHRGRHMMLTHRRHQRPAGRTRLM